VANKKEQHPLKFAYVYIDWASGRDDQGIYKIFEVLPELFRARVITLEGGTEQEGDNMWIPWTSIDFLTQVTGK
jgi:hypothetical protein